MLKELLRNRYLIVILSLEITFGIITMMKVNYFAGLAIVLISVNCFVDRLMFSRLESLVFDMVGVISEYDKIIKAIHKKREELLRENKN